MTANQKNNKKILLLIVLILMISSGQLLAQTGPFLRFSLGPGISNEYDSLKESAFTIATKNHALGWKINDKYAVYYSEFGAFIKNGSEDYTNLDAYGLGVGYQLKNDLSIHFSGAWATVHFSDDWKKQGDYIEDGFAVALGLEKTWSVSRKFNFGLGPHALFQSSKNYKYTNISLNFWLDFYLFSQGQK